MFSYTERPARNLCPARRRQRHAVEQRVYDDSKRLKEVHRPDGKLVTFEYKQESDRLIRIVSPRGKTDFEYDLPSQDHAFDGFLRLRSFIAIVVVAEAYRVQVPAEPSR